MGTLFSVSMKVNPSTEGPSFVKSEEIESNQDPRKTIFRYPPRNPIIKGKLIKEKKRKERKRKTNDGDMNPASKDRLMQKMCQGGTEWYVRKGH